MDIRILDNTSVTDSDADYILRQVECGGGACPDGGGHNMGDISLCDAGSCTVVSLFTQYAPVVDGVVTLSYDALDQSVRRFIERTGMSSLNGKRVAVPWGIGDVRGDWDVVRGILESAFSSVECTVEYCRGDCESHEPTTNRQQTDNNGAGFKFEREVAHNYGDAVESTPDGNGFGVPGEHKTKH